MAKIILSTLICYLIFFNNLNSQIQNEEDNIYFDAIAFKGDSANLHRIDCFVIVPYELIDFRSKGENYVADINIVFQIINIETNESETKSIRQKVVSKDYFESQGGTGKSETIFKKLYVKKGSYKVKTTLKGGEGKSYAYTRSVNILNYDKYDISTSGLMLLKSIEERDGGLQITPHFSDDVSNISESFFVFFEIYSNLEESKKITLAYLLVDENGQIKYSSKPQKKQINKGRNQSYLLIKPKGNISGEQLLKVIVLKNDTDDILDQSNYIAISERLINFTPEDLNDLFSDIDISIRQLRYVADKETIENMQELESLKEKKEAFMDFWKSRDPTPRTATNEAMNEYFNRIAIASKNFKSYADGWLTDMGMVYIVLGPPSQVFNNNQNRANRVSYERWVYGNGSEYIFEDRTGFGDYRLVRPIGFNEKYEYRR